MKSNENLSLENLIQNLKVILMETTWSVMLKREKLSGIKIEWREKSETCENKSDSKIDFDRNTIVAHTMTQVNTRFYLSSKSLMNQGS